MVILVVCKVFLVVKNLENLIQIVPDSPIYYYFGGIDIKSLNITFFIYLPENVIISNL